MKKIWIPIEKDAEGEFIQIGSHFFLKTKVSDDVYDMIVSGQSVMELLKEFAIYKDENYNNLARSYYGDINDVLIRNYLNKKEG